MRKMCVILLALLIAVPAFASGERSWGPSKFRPATGEKVEGEYIVVYDDSLAAGVIADLANSHASEHSARVDRVWTKAIKGALLSGLNENRARALSRKPQVAWVEENAVVTAVATQSNPTWGLDRSDQRALPLSSSYTYNYDGSGINAYVLDTGIRTSHNDFGGRASWGTNTIDTNNSDCNGHGTHVAGTIGGSTYGIAKNVQLHAVKVLNCQGSGTTASVVDGIEWVQNNRVDPAVANMSLGGGASSTLDNAVNNAVNSGVFFAVAAGNESTDACTRSPARAAEAYTVGSTTSSDSMSSFSNYGSCVDIFAPGSSITSTWHTSNSATNTISGTSMASPHVAGVAALILDENPGLTPDQVKAELTDSATCDVVSGIPSGPNLLLYSLGGTDPNCGAPPPPPPPPGSCPTGYNVYTGTATTGGPDLVTANFNGSGNFHGLLICDVGAADLDLYLDKESCDWWSCGMSPVASSTSAGCDEEINHNNSSGVYRWRVDHYSGPNESFTLCVNQG